MAEMIVNLYEAKMTLSSLVERAAAGEEIIIAKAGHPMARLVAVPKAATRRKPGGRDGRVKIAQDFDDPLPDKVLAGFEGRG